MQAINALIGGLDLEVEDAQFAMDAVLAAQISRGQWGRAAESATESMLLSVALAEKVRGVLAETEHDVRTVDWVDAVPSLLSNARTIISRGWACSTTSPIPEIQKFQC